MLKIFANHNKQDITYSFSVGQAFPNVQGKLLRIEISGYELEQLVEAKEIPIYTHAENKPVKTICLVWNNKEAGRILKDLRDLFDK